VVTFDGKPNELWCGRRPWQFLEVLEDEAEERK
jgi:hypothetical protein